MAGMVTVLVALPFVAGVTTLVYIDRRMRVEGLATTLTASSDIADPTAAITPPGPAGPANPTGPTGPADPTG